jgi:hypothetical protein
MHSNIPVDGYLKMECSYLNLVAWRAKTRV